MKKIISVAFVLLLLNVLTCLYELGTRYPAQSISKI